MDLEKEKGKMVMKILRRDSSVGGSSRIFYYYGSGEGVPFEWEKKPGIPKHQPKEELPPLSPPPALLSLGLPKPHIAHHNPKPSLATTLRRRFWKTVTRKGGKRNKKLLGSSGNEEEDEEVKDFDVFERFLECNSDFESFASPRDSSLSSSSSSSLSLCRQVTRSESLAREVCGNGRPLGCIPMHFTCARTLISIMKQRWYN